MKFVRFLPLFIPFLLFLFLEIFYFWPRTIYLILPIIILLYSATCFLFTKRSAKDNKWWRYIILPSYFTVGLVIFTLMISNRLIVQSLFILDVIFIYYYFNIIYYYLVKVEDYKNYAWENISSYGNFLGIYFTASAIYGLQSFLDTPVWLVILVIMFVISLAVYQVFLSNNIKKELGFFYILLSCFVLVELAWTITFLPSSFYILGLLFSVCYYMLVGLIRFYLLKKLDSRVIKLYLIYGFSSILLVLLTARWM